MNPFLLFIFTKLASTASLLIVIAIVILYMIWKNQYKIAATLGVCSLGVMLTVTLLKEQFKVARPSSAMVELASYAFPSGHAAGATFLALVLGFLSWRLPSQLKLLAVGACVITGGAIALSRIYLGVHTVLQVSAGFFIGLLFGSLFIYIVSTPK